MLPWEQDFTSDLSSDPILLSILKYTNMKLYNDILKNTSTITISRFIHHSLRLFSLSFVMTLMIFSTAMAQPAVPELSAPSDSAFDQPQNLTLSWKASASADTYTLQVSGDQNFGSMVFNESLLTDTTQFISNLDLNTSYYWRVNATNTSGTSDFSSQRIFTVWESVPTSPDSVNLGTSGNYVLLAKTAISTVPASAITGDVGVSPAAETYITGFNLTDATGYATSPQVTGKVYASDMASPTPSNLTTAVSDMETAFTDAAGRVDPDFFELHVGDIGGKTLIPGLYKWTNTVIAPGSFEISGDENAIWIFQIAGDLTVSSDINVTLAGGAQAKNIFWQVSGEVNIGTNAHFEGIILSMTAINLNTGASLTGRALAQSAITLDQNVITQPTFTQATSVDRSDQTLPATFTLSQNYPNPFNPSTMISYQVPVNSKVRLEVFNMLGQSVALLVNEQQAAGSHTVRFDASALTSGMYLYRIHATGFNQTRKMMLIK